MLRVIKSLGPAHSSGSRLLINCWFLDHFPGGAVDQEQRPIGDGRHTGYADDRRNAERPRDDRGVGGSSSLLGEDGQAARSIEPCSVRRRKINCEQDEGVSRVGYARDRATRERGGHPVADVVEVETRSAVGVRLHGLCRRPTRWPPIRNALV